MGDYILNKPKCWSYGRLAGAWSGYFAALLWWRHMDWSVRAILFTLGLAFTPFVLPRLIETRGRDKFSLTFGALGVLSILSGIFWPFLPIAGSAFAASANRFSSDFRVWLLIFLLTWFYGAIASVIYAVKRDRMAEVIERDIIPLRVAMERFVLPRKLTPAEIDRIGAYLSGFRPYMVNFIVNEGDEEAGSYRADIQRALAQGGWTVGRIDYRSGMRAGLTYEYRYTRETEAKRSDPREKLPDQLLKEAMREAQIPFDGGGGGSDDKDSLTIHVGQRRRDAHARPQGWS